MDNSYEATNEDVIEKANKNVKKTVQQLWKKGYITKDLKEYLNPKHPKAGNLKGNPKLHKKDHPYRTIVSGIGTPTEHMAEVVEKELNEYVIGSPSYIRDTTDFLNKLGEIEEPLDKNVILFCFDVVKLYPSVPMKEGLEACREALDSRTHPEIPTEATMSMIKTVLENNVFNLKDKYFIQTDGVAIGSRLGRNFACAYMRKWDTHLMDFENTPLFYNRYIDDGFGIWQHGLESLKKFIEHANSIHPNIKVELRYSEKKIEFLDTYVEIENRKIKTDLFVKATDKHLYVESKSCHPNNVKKSIPFGLGIRLKRICSDDKDYRIHRIELKKQLRKRGYSGKFIESQLQRVDNMSRENLLQNKNTKKKQQERVPMVLTYSRHLPNVREIVNKHLKILHQSERMESIFGSPPILAFRRDRNLGDVLVHGKLNKVLRGDLNFQPQVKECNCDVCSKFSDRSSVEDGKGKAFNIKSFFRCQTQNVVYGLYCKRCMKVVYVGETERTVQERVKEHLADIRHDRPKPVAKHFNNDGHSSDDVEVMMD